jgi:hypothetical protein
MCLLESTYDMKLLILILGAWSTEYASQPCLVNQRIHLQCGISTPKRDLCASIPGKNSTDRSQPMDKLGLEEDQSPM